MALTAANAELNVPAELRNSQWTLADKVVKLLPIFEEATREVCGNYSSAALVIPIVNSIYHALEVLKDDRGIKSMKILSSKIFMCSNHFNCSDQTEFNCVTCFSSNLLDHINTCTS